MDSMNAAQINNEPSDYDLTLATVDGSHTMCNKWFTQAVKNKYSEVAEKIRNQRHLEDLLGSVIIMAPSFLTHWCYGLGP